MDNEQKPDSTDESYVGMSRTPGIFNQDTPMQNKVSEDESKSDLDFNFDDAEIQDEEPVNEAPKDNKTTPKKPRTSTEGKRKPNEFKQKHTDSKDSEHKHADLKSESIHILKEKFKEHREELIVEENFNVNEDVFDRIGDICKKQNLIRNNFLNDVLKGYFLEGEINNVKGGLINALETVKLKSVGIKTPRKNIKVFIPEDIKFKAVDVLGEHKKRVPKISKGYLFEAILIDALEKLEN